MLNSLRPVSSSSGVTGSGKSAVGWPSAFIPVTIAADGASPSRCETVPATSGRDERPSLKTGLRSNGFRCESSRISRLHPVRSPAAPSKHEAARIRSVRECDRLAFNFVHSDRVEGLEKALRLFEIELGV